VLLLLSLIVILLIVDVPFCLTPPSAPLFFLFHPFLLSPCLFICVSGAARVSRWQFEGATTGSSSSTSNIAHPPGYSKGNFDASSSSSSRRNGESKLEQIKASAMAVATSPGKNLFMHGLMLWMSGSTLQIFSIMMLGMAFWTPIKAILSTGTAFQRYQSSGVDITLQKLIYVVLNMCGLCMALYKCQSMGLLPSGSDFLDNDVPHPLEHASGHISFNGALL
jgi:ER membrane protein complex subunit 4